MHFFLKKSCTYESPTFSMKNCRQEYSCEDTENELPHVPLTQQTFCPAHAGSSTICNLLLLAEFLCVITGFWGSGCFLRTVLARPGYRIYAIPPYCSATTVITGAASGPHCLFLLPFANKAALILTLFWVDVAPVQVQTLAVSAFAMCGHCADKPTVPTLILSLLRTYRPVFQMILTMRQF